MICDDRELAVAAEQYRYWKWQGLTHHEMMTACQARFRAGMSGDDVIVELVHAWNGLDRVK